MGFLSALPRKSSAEDPKGEGCLRSERASPAPDLRKLLCNLNASVLEARSSQIEAAGATRLSPPRGRPTYCTPSKPAARLHDAYWLAMPLSLWLVGCAPTTASHRLVLASWRCRPGWQ